MLKLTAQDFHRRYAPKKCDLRIFLRERGVEESSPSEFEQVLMRMGQRYEAKHLATFPEAIDLRSFESDKRLEQTVTLVKNGCAVLYQPVLKVQTTLDGVECEFVGEPDFLLRENNGYIIRDVKMARRVDEEHHPEILFQLQFYGWLYEQVFGAPPIRLEALNGQGDIVPIPLDHQAVLVELRALIGLKRLSQEPYEPVGWSKCVSCGFRDHCWPKAIAAKDVALVYEIDQSLATELHERGAASIPQLVEHFNVDSLSELKRPWGKRFQKVGKKADMILQRARVMLSGREVLLHPPIIPRHEHYVMFDLEGMPPHLDELDKIYLWGTQVFGKSHGEFMPAVSGFGDDGDREGWKQFLTNAQSIFQQFGDIPFIHWHHYEKTHLDDYVERYGDPEGVAARVRRNLLDFNCNSCGTHILIDEAGAGMSVQCPKCNQPLTVPTASVTDSPSVSAPSSPIAPTCLYTLFRGRGPSKLTQIIGAQYFYRTPSQTVEGPFNKLEMRGLMRKKVVEPETMVLCPATQQWYRTHAQSSIE